MHGHDLESIARALVEDGKGILAADESTGTIKKRLASIDIESTEATRRSYREMLFTAPGIEEFISGVILYDETIRQSASRGVPFTEVLYGKGIIPGIKVDKGAKDLPFHPGEKVTEGLDGLRERLDEYQQLGARFTKWRAVIQIGEDIPSRYCIDVNAQALARFAALSQAAGLAPIVEPEVLMEGTHDLEHSAQVTQDTLAAVFSELKKARVALEGILLKPNMVLPGYQSPQKASVSEVAEATLRVLRRVVPPAVPGIVFLSGGQSPEQASVHLNAMNSKGEQPWQLSFSFGRALQDQSLKAWGGEQANMSTAQRILFHRAKANSAATFGQYTKAMEEAVS